MFYKEFIFNLNFNLNWNFYVRKESPARRSTKMSLNDDKKIRLGGRAGEARLHTSKANKII